jgi:hypothetical protein
MSDNKKKRPAEEEEEEQERAEAVYLLLVVMVEDNSTMAYRIPSGDLDEEQLEILERYNNGHDANGGDEAKAIRNTIKYLSGYPEYKRMNMLGMSIKKPRDVVLDVFLFYTEAEA